MAPDWQKDLQEAMGRRLREQMKELDITQQKLAKGLGVSQAAIYKYLKGMARISKETLEKIKTLGFDSFYIETGNVTSEIESLKDENAKLKEEILFCKKIIEQQSETLKNISQKK